MFFKIFSAENFPVGVRPRFSERAGGAPELEPARIFPRGARPRGAQPPRRRCYSRRPDTRVPCNPRMRRGGPRAARSQVLHPLRAGHVLVRAGTRHEGGRAEARPRAAPGQAGPGVRLRSVRRGRVADVGSGRISDAGIVSSRHSGPDIHAPHQVHASPRAARPSRPPRPKNRPRQAK